MGHFETQDQDSGLGVTFGAYHCFLNVNWVGFGIFVCDGRTRRLLANKRALNREGSDSQQESRRSRQAAKREGRMTRDKRRGCGK